MKIIVYILICFSLTICRVYSQDITYDMVKITLDSVLNCDLVPDSSDLIAIDISQTNLTKADHASILKYLKEKYPNTQEMTRDTFFIMNTPPSRPGHWTRYFISISPNESFMTFKPDPSNSNFKRLFFLKFYSESDGLNGWSEFDKVDDKYVFKYFKEFDYY